MKKLILLITLVVSPVFAQEEEQEVQIEIETGGGVEVGVTGESNRAIAAFPDKSVWYFSDIGRNDDAMYCYVDDGGNPHCKIVDIED